MNTFPAKLDGQAKALTVIILSVLIIPFMGIASRYQANKDYKLIVVPVVVVVALLIVALFRPKSYLINPSVLKIAQVGFSRTVLTEQIESIVPVDNLGFGLRAFGSGGFLGYLGKFWYKKSGFITFYVSDRHKMLLVTLKNGRKLMISPDDTEGFLTAFKAAKAQ